MTTRHEFQIIQAPEVAQHLDDGWQLHGNPIPIPTANPLNPKQGQVVFVQAMWRVVWRDGDGESEPEPTLAG